MNTQAYCGAYKRLKMRLMAAVILLFSSQAHADLIIRSGASVTVNSSAVVNVNCTDILVNTGATFSLSSATVRNLDNLVQSIGSTVNNSGGTLETCRPLFTKSFVPNRIKSGQVTTLSYVINNQSTSDATGFSFTDVLDSIAPLNELIVATPSNASTSCPSGNVVATPGDGVVSFNSGALLAGNSCTVSVDVTSFAVNTHMSTSGDLTSNLGSSGSATAELLVEANSVVGGAPAFFSLSTDPLSAIGPGSSSTMTCTIAEPSGVVVTDLAFTHTLPANVRFSSLANPQTNCSSATLSASNGGSVLTFSSDFLAPNASCTVSVNITSSTAAVYTLTTGNLTSSAGNSGTASANFSVSNGIPVVNATISPSSVNVGERATITYLIDNTLSGTNYTSPALTDTLPAGLVIADPANFTSSCGLDAAATRSADPGSRSFSVISSIGLSPLAAGSSCQISLDVTANAAGVFVVDATSLSVRNNFF